MKQPLTLAGILCLWLLCALTSAHGQSVFDDFSDDNFSQNPTWFGTGTLFKINSSKQLQSNNGSQSESYLALPISIPSECEWQVWFKCSFNPSTQNVFRWYILSDSLNPSLASHALFVKAGGGTGSSDSLSLWEKTPSGLICRIAGRYGTLGKSINQARVRIRKTIHGDWTMESDTTGNENWQTEGLGNWPLFANFGFEALRFTCTSGNATKLYVDDIYTGGFRIDSIPPTLFSATRVANNAIEWQFSEKLDSNTLRAANFVCSDSSIEISAEWANNSHDRIRIGLSSDMLNKTAYRFTLHGIRDFVGNLMSDTSCIFKRIEPDSGELIITEIMADPSPMVGLPETEYVEIYNSGNDSIWMEELQLHDATSYGVSKGVGIQAHGYALLVPSASVSLFPNVSTVYGMSSFPSLNNEGDSLSLIDNFNQYLHAIHYQLEDYHDETKSQGGFAIELIRPEYACLGASNRHASMNLQGGTPGYINSIPIPDDSFFKPQLLHTYLYDSSDIQLVLHNQPNFNSLFIQTNFVHNTMQFHRNYEWDTLHIPLPVSLKQQQFVRISMDSMQNCIGLTNSDSITFTWIETHRPKQNDVLITEVFPHPLANDSMPNLEWIELYNTTEFKQNLNGFKLCTLSDTALLSTIVIEPHAYILLCKYGYEAELSKYGKSIGVHYFPTLNHNEQISLCNEQHWGIHQMQYSDASFQRPYTSNGGWSLELGNDNNPCNHSEAWSVSTSPKRATPAAANDFVCEKVDTEKPHIVRLFPEKDSLVHVYFSETMQLFPMYTYDSALHVLSGMNDDVLVRINSSAYSSNQYIQIPSFPDCAGNWSDTLALPFGPVNTLHCEDVSISELLFNPQSGGYDYIELYNRSKHFIDASKIRIGNESEQYVCSKTPLLFPPETYLTFTENRSDILNRYHVLNPDNLIESAHLPAFPDASGMAAWFLDTMQCESFYYRENMHYPLLSNVEGVSLEKIRLNSMQDDAGNWCSASRFSGNGTPTYKNSESEWQSDLNTDETFQVSSSLFSPNNDGFEDALIFYGKLPQSGYSANLQVLNMNGVCVAMPWKNQLLGTEYSWNWNGVGLNQTPLETGMYLVVFDAIHPQGNHIQKQLPISIYINTKP